MKMVSGCIGIMIVLNYYRIADPGKFRGDRSCTITVLAWDGQSKGQCIK